MEFRQATEDDADSIAHLHTDSWKKTYRGMMSDTFLDEAALPNRLATWHERLGKTRADQFTLLALDGDKLAGFVCAYGSEDPQWGSYIDNLHVRPDFHRRGIGSALMRATARWLIEHHGGSGMYLWVMQANAPARRFYERLNAEDCGTIMKTDPGGGCAPNCRYAWTRPESLLTANSALGDCAE